MDFEKRYLIRLTAILTSCKSYIKTQYLKGCEKIEQRICETKWYETKSNEMFMSDGITRLIRIVWQKLLRHSTIPHSKNKLIFGYTLHKSNIYVSNTK